MEEEDIFVQIPVEDDGLEVESVEEFSYNEDAINMVVDFMRHTDGIKALKEIADQVHTDFENAWESTEEYRQRFADDYKLFTGDLPPKTFPYKNSANAHIPIALENTARLTFRIAAELFGDWSAPLGVVPIGPGDEQVADILTKHGNWQIRNQITSFRRQMMRGLQFYVFNGDVVCLSKYDPIKKCNAHEILTPDEFVVPYTMVSVEPDFSDLPYKMQVIRYYRHELQKMRGIWENVDAVLKNKPTPWDDDPEPKLLTSNAEVKRIEIPEGGKHTPYVLIQYEGWTDKLPGQIDDRYVKVIIDKNTKHVLHLSIHEEEDWQDRIRYEREMAELQAYRAGKAAYDAQTEEMSKMDGELAATMNSETADDMEKAEASVQMDALRTMPLSPAPIPPQWMVDPDDLEELPREPKRVPINMYSHGVCIEPLVGVTGLSYGRILSDLNRAANVSMSQFVDAATLGNCWSGLVSEDFDTKGTFSIEPGKLNKVPGMSGDDIRKAFYELKPSPANPQLIEVVRMAMEMGQSAVQAPDVLSGAEGKSGETYRGHSARIEQATLQLGVIARNFAHFFEQVLKNNAKLNSIYLPDEEMVNISARPGTGVEQLMVRRDMYKRNYQVEIRSDLRFTSMAQRVAEADEIVAMVQANMMLAGNPAMNYQAVKRALIARNRQDLIPFLGPPPPPPQMPMAPPPPPPGEGAPQ